MISTGPSSVRRPERSRSCGRSLPVDWNVFDRDLLERIVLGHPGFTALDPPDLNVDWPAVRERMLRFHGYPYTSVGIALIKC